MMADSARDVRASARGSAMLAAILIAAGLLRLYKITAFSLWFDESVSVGLSGYPWPQLFAHIAQDTTPPLYFVVLKLWRLILGDSLLALRSLSLVFEIAAVWFGYLFVSESASARHAARLARVRRRDGRVPIHALLPDICGCRAGGRRRGHLSA